MVLDELPPLKKAISILNTKRNLLIHVPAHDSLYSKFDEAVGHFKRYEINKLNDFTNSFFL